MREKNIVSSLIYAILSLKGVLFSFIISLGEVLILYKQCLFRGIYTLMVQKHMFIQLSFTILSSLAHETSLKKDPFTNFNIF